MKEYCCTLEKKEIQETFLEIRRTARQTGVLEYKTHEIVVNLKKD